MAFDDIPTYHKAFISNSCDIKEPSLYAEASTYPLWVEAMNKEIAALHAKQYLGTC